MSIHEIDQQAKAQGFEENELRAYRLGFLSGQVKTIEETQSIVQSVFSSPLQSSLSKLNEDEQRQMFLHNEDENRRAAEYFEMQSWEKEY